MNDLQLVVDDGFESAAAAASDNLIRGDMIKLVGGKFFAGREQRAVRDGTQFSARGAAAAWQKWEDNKPVETRVQLPGQIPLRREDLDTLQAGDWPAGPDGQPRDPWQFTRYLYLATPSDMAVYTFCTSSWSGRSAVSQLADQIIRMRTVPGRGNACPIIELESAPHKTKFGTHMKPIFKIVGWTGTPDNRGPVASIAPPAAHTVIVDEMNDQIPW